MNKATRAAAVLLVVVAAIYATAPAVGQSISPGDLRLTAAAIKVDTAADNARAQALINQAKEIERQNAVATAEQNKVNATATELAKPTKTPIPTLTPTDTPTPQPSATSAATQTPVVVYVGQAAPTVAPSMAESSDPSRVGEGAPKMSTFGFILLGVLGLGLVIVLIRFLLVQMAKGQAAESEARSNRLDDFSERMRKIRERK